MGWVAGKVFPKGRRRDLADRVNRCRLESWMHQKKASDPVESIERREDLSKSLDLIYPERISLSCVMVRIRPNLRRN
jgi:hypothetical protein